MKKTMLTYRTLDTFENEYKTEQYTPAQIERIEFAAYVANMNQLNHPEWTQDDIFAEFLRVMDIEKIETEKKNTEEQPTEKKGAAAMSYTISKNAQYNSIEITFTEKPSEAIRDALKALKFRWHSVKKVWYGYTTEEEARAAIEGQKIEKKPTEAKPAAPKVNKFGVQVGDLFEASWGYDQTNVDFFQVIALVGESSVRVRQVYPPMTKEEPTGPMAADRTYQITKELLPPASYSVFIKDQEKGDLKRLKSYAADGKSQPEFTLSSFASAYLCEGNTTKVYESWYA